MNENENVPFDSIPQLHTGSFLTNEQAEQFRDTFKNLTVVVRCKDCKHSCDYTDIFPDRAYKCMKNGGFHNDSWFCADGERRTDDA